MPTDTGSEIEIKSPDEAAQLVIHTLDVIPAKIKSPDEYQACMGQLAIAKKRIGAVEGFFEKLRKPFNAALKENRKQESGILEPLQDRYRKLKSLCDSYFLIEQAKATTKQDKANEDHDKKVADAIAKGKDPATVAPPKQVESKAATRVEVAPGVSVSMKMDKHFRLTESGVTSRTLIDEPKTKMYRDDIGMQGIPDNCWQLNHTRLLDIIKAGVKVPGVELIELPSNTVRG